MHERRGQARHDLIWLERDAATSARACASPTADAHALLADWIAAERPLILARQPRDLAPGRVLLGMPLPPAKGKHRLAFDLPIARITRTAPPPPLAVLASHIPKSWRSTLDALLADPVISAANPRAFGSAAMQALTGLTCITDDSDLDLLLAPTSREAAIAAMASLADIDATGKGPRLDGEFVDRQGRASSWRELLRGSRHVLVKQLDAVGMTAHEDFLAGFGARPA